MLTNFASLILFSILLVNIADSKPAANCKKCLEDSLNYIDHYKYLGCKEIVSKDCPQCIERFECPRLPLEGKELDIKKCHVANVNYNVGETIAYKKKFCKFCTCVDSPLPPAPGAEEGTNDDGNDDDDEEEAPAPASERTPLDIFNASAAMLNKPPPKYNPLPLDTNYEAKITCTTSSQPFSILTNPNANEYCFFKENECSYLKQCVSTEKLEKENCQYQGKKYAFGEMIYPEEEDRCLKCKCNANWTNNISQMVKQCERINCDLEDSYLNQGCIPIYENKCCPNNYHCPDEDKPKNPEPVKQGKCYFNGKNYDVGSKLKTDNSYLDCTCKMGPYFTCIMTNSNE